MSEIGTAYVLIEPTAKGLGGKIENEMNGVGEKAGGSFSKGFGKILKGGGAIAATTLALGTAATSALVNSTKELASYGDDIDKMSQKMGMSAEAYQEWDAVMQHSGTSMETMKTSMKTLATAAETGNEAFEALGMTQEEIANMSQEQLFESTITALQKVDNETERTYLAGKLLGRGATELGALLNTSAEDTQAMRDRVHELGGVMSDEAVKASAAFQDQMQDMNTAFAGIGRQLLSDFLPSMTTVMSGLTEIFSGNTEGGGNLISEGFTNLMNGIIAKLPELLQIAGVIVKAVGDAILANLPSLLRTGLSIIVELAQGIVAAIPELIPALTDVIVQMALMLTEPDTLVSLIEAAIQIIIALADGLLKAVPQLVAAIPVIIENLVRTIIELAPKLLTAAWELIKVLVKGVVDGWESIKVAVVDLWNRLKNLWSEKIGDVKKWGRDLIDNFIGGIKEKWESFKQTLSDLATTVKDFLGFSVPEKGPLHEWAFNNPGYDMVELFTEGMQNAQPNLEAALSQDIAAPMYNTMAGGENGANENGAGTPNFIIRLEGDAAKFFTYTIEQNRIYKRTHGGDSAYA